MKRAIYPLAFGVSALLFALAAMLWPQSPAPVADAQVPSYVETSLWNDIGSPGAVMYTTSGGYVGYLNPGQTVNVNTNYPGEVRSVYVGTGVCANLYRVVGGQWGLYRKIRSSGYWSLPYVNGYPTDYFIAWRGGLNSCG